jgi:hypothetical protein
MSHSREYADWSPAQRHEYLLHQRAHLKEKIDHLRDELKSVDAQLAGTAPIDKQDVINGYRRAEADYGDRSPRTRRRDRDK